MSHQCVHCGKVYPNACKELIEGCSCGARFFFYIRNEAKLNKMSESLQELAPEEKVKIEQDIREIMKANEEETPVILDLESVRVCGPGKFEIDLVSLFNKKKPIIYKLEEGKYIIDLASTMMIKEEGK